MAEDWLSDVQKYDPGADPDVVAGIVRYCGIALRKRDSALVSFTSDDEVARVRNNFLRKKLALDHSDDDLNVAIGDVGERMRGDNTKNRVTVYYLLSQAFDRHDTFRKAPKTKAAPKGDDVVAAGPAAEPVAPEPVAAPEPPPAQPDEVVSPVVSLGGESAAAPETARPAEPVAPAAFGRKVSNGVPPPPANPIRSTVAEHSPSQLVEEEESGGSRWWLWLILAVVAVAVVLWWLTR